MTDEDTFDRFNRTGQSPTITGRISPPLRKHLTLVPPPPARPEQIVPTFTRLMTEARVHSPGGMMRTEVAAVVSRTAKLCGVSDREVHETLRKSTGAA